MKTQTIPRAEWASLFANFSRRHQGWLVELEVSPRIKAFTAKVGDQIEADHLALGGITAELSNDGDDRIEIMLGEKPEDHVTHNIAVPTEVNIIRTDAGADVMIEVKSSDGRTTALRLLYSILPEMVNGAVA
jgi:hypothetical protein